MLPLVCVGFFDQGVMQGANGTYYSGFGPPVYMKFATTGLFVPYATGASSDCKQAANSFGASYTKGFPDPAEYYNMTDTILYGAFSDGAILGWGIVGAMVAAWAIMVLVRASK